MVFEKSFNRSARVQVLLVTQPKQIDVSRVSNQLGGRQKTALFEKEHRARASFT